MWTAETLIRLGGCPGWSESSQGAHVILLVLSWGGSNVFSNLDRLRFFLLFFSFNFLLSFCHSFIVSLSNILLKYYFSCLFLNKVISAVGHFFFKEIKLLYLWRKNINLTITACQPRPPPAVMSRWRGALGEQLWPLQYGVRCHHYGDYVILLSLIRTT